MTVPLCMLLGFVAWTLFVLCLGIAPFRVGSVLMGKARPNQFPADTPHGPDWYRRLMRAHANCVENLPLFAAVVLVGHVAGVRDPLFSTLSEVYLAARVGQTVAHISSGRSLVINVRFTFFLVQIAALVWMMARIGQVGAFVG
jgi:uncharacterized MAPEG superfamily protein